MSKLSQKHFLLCVLDWGLGHATRCIPIITELLKDNQQVTIAGNGHSLKLLKDEFPYLSFFELPAYSVKYSETSFFFSNLSWQVPKLLSAIRSEHIEMKRIIAKIKPDVIISDNRYGCYSEQAYTVFITHQLNMQLPFPLSIFRIPVNNLNTSFIKNFNNCWVPDYPERILTGSLTENDNIPISFVGTLSRFRYQNVQVNQNQVVGIVSGPEPQRTLFEELLIKEFSKLEIETVIVRGQPQDGQTDLKIGKVRLISHLPSKQLQSLISGADIVVARSGYSTIMDLMELQKQKIILIPTPGQTEQEYLAHQLNAKGIAYSSSQEKFDIILARSDVNKYRGFVNSHAGVNLLRKAINSLYKTSF